MPWTYDDNGILEPSSCYCEHGTYIGTPYGADHICGYCEDGVTIEELHAQHREAQKREALAHLFLLNDWLQHACRMLAEDSSPSIRRAAERCDRLTWGKGMALAAGQTHLAAANAELRRRRAGARTA